MHFTQEVSNNFIEVNGSLSMKVKEKGTLALYRPLTNMDLPSNAIDEWCDGYFIYIAMETAW